MSRSKATRTAAWCAVGAGVLAPLVRRRLKAPALLVQGVAFAAPVGVCVAAKRSKARDVATCALQMWAYVNAYQMPYDDPDRQLERVHVRYPMAVDRVLGLGELPTIRLQRALARLGPDGPRWRALDRTLIWAHWLWFTVPHVALAYILARRPERFTRAAVMTYAVFDIGACVYWLHPTAPPWFAVAHGSAGLPPIAGAGADAADEPAHAQAATARAPSARVTAAAFGRPRGGAAASGIAPGAAASRVARAGVDRGDRPARGFEGGATDAGTGYVASADARSLGARSAANRSHWRAHPEHDGAVAVRRMMVEYGEGFWRSRWEPMYGVLGGNPLAAMPSLHFATSLMAAILLAEAQPLAGAAGATYCTTLGFALVYLGEHYVADLIGGAALTAAVYRLGPGVAPALARAGRAVSRLEALAHEA